MSKFVSREGLKASLGEFKSKMLDKLSAGKTLYVNGATGDDGNDGLSAESPFKTIQAAINACAVTNNNGESPLNTINVDPNSTYDYISVRGKSVKIKSTGVINIVTDENPAIFASQNGYLNIAADINVEETANHYTIAAQHKGELYITGSITLNGGKGVYIDQGSTLKHNKTLTINTSTNNNIIRISDGSNAQFSNVVLTNTFPGGIDGATICATYNSKLEISTLAVTEDRKSGAVAAVYNSEIHLENANITDNSVDNVGRDKPYLYTRGGSKLTADTVTINNTNLNIANTSIAFGAYEDGITQIKAMTVTNVGTEYMCDMSSIYLSPNISCVGKAGDISVLPLLEADRNITITSDERISALDENTQYAAIPDDVIDVICTTATEDAWVFDKNNVPTRTNVSSALTSIDGMMSPYEGHITDDDLTSEDYKAVYHIPDLTNVTSARSFCYGNTALKYINLEAFRRGGNITTMNCAFCYANSLAEIDTTPLKALTRCTNADYIFYNYQGTHLDWTFLGSMPLSGPVESVINTCKYLRTLDLSFITNAWSGVTELNQVVRDSCFREDFVGVLDISPLAQLTNLKKLQYTVCNLSVDSNDYLCRGVEKLTGCQALNTLVNMEDASGFLCYNHWTEGIDYSFLATWTKLTMYRHFSDGNRGKTVDLTPFANLTRLNNIAYFCANMWELEKLDMTPLNDCPINTEVQILQNDNMLVDLTLPSRAWFAQAAVTNIDLSYLTGWVKNVNTSINNLYDRATNSLPTFTIKLSNASYAMLTQEDITAAVAKGYTIVK
jgi:hypothetical protein